MKRFLAYALIGFLIATAVFKGCSIPTFGAEAVTQIKVMNYTRLQNATTANISYTGVGFQPVYIQITAGHWGTMGNSWSQGWCRDDGGSGLVFMSGSFVYAGGSDTDSQRVVETWDGGSNYQYASVKSFDPDGFTLAWIGGGSAGGTICLIVTCYGLESVATPQWVDANYLASVNVNSSITYYLYGQGYAKQSWVTGLNYSTMEWVEDYIAALNLTGGEGGLAEGPVPLWLFGVFGVVAVGSFFSKSAILYLAGVSVCAIGMILMITAGNWLGMLVFVLMLVFGLIAIMKARRF